MDNSNPIRQLLLIGVGTTSLVAEKLREVSERWVREGKLDPEDARKFVDDLMEQMRDQSNFEAQLERQLRNVMNDFGVARQSELDELRGRLDRLEHQVRDLENRSWK
ncbi:phasin family protein [Geitlerinema sp. PCC 9228]|jgi:polyhydroxyalkanoate synthesis regulator phasin|uniref:phasin family protein n=1 Tax=Geitlerinema sp. PCC 9228 TaxID=111611 RepID=UPI0008F9C17A|nr:phasin family protein [Geitlerinema sp. PCC 9228]